MKKVITNKKRVLSIVLSLLMIVSVISFPKLTAKADGVDDFIGRCYKVTLGRDADSDGYAYWRDILVNRKQDGSVVAHGFMFSPEYIDKNTPNEQYVKDLYMLFMGREPEQSGYDYWCEKIANGESREQIFAGFANSKEYYDLCYGYGITAGYYTADYGIQQVNGVNLFVERMYQTSLDRLGDQNGQNDWVQALLEGRITGIECARCFVQSPEFINKGLSNEEYLKSLYRAFMGREYDQGGLDYWLENMNNGYTRDEVFAGFANSPEFEGICNFYGIIRGDYTPTDIGNKNEQEVNKKKIKKIKSVGEHYGYYWWNETEYDINGNIIENQGYDYYEQDFYSEYDVQYDGYHNKGKYDNEGRLLEWMNIDQEGNVYNWEKNVYDKYGDVVRNYYLNSDGTIRWGTVATSGIENGIKVKDFFYYQDENDPEYDGKLAYTKEYEYNSNGNRIKETEYDSDGIIKNCIEYYDNGIKKSNIWYSDGSYSSVREYDINGNLTKEAYYSDGQINYWFDREYDSNNNLIHQKAYNSDGSYRSNIEYSYDKFGFETVVGYNEDGSIYTYSVGNYDEESNVVTIITYTGDGRLWYWEEYQLNDNYDIIAYNKSSSDWYTQEIEYFE